MKKAVVLLTAFLLFASAGYSQPKSTNSPTLTAPATDAAAIDLAKATYAVHGGDKLRAMKTLVVKGSVDLTSSSFPQAIPGVFSMAFAGDKYRIELANAIQSFKQSFDGEQTYTSVQLGFSLPPMNRLGFPLFHRLGDKGFVVTKLPATAKGKIGFRMTAPDGFFTDFLVDEKTGQIKGFESQYDFHGRTFTTSVVVDKYRTIDGVVVPEKYSQRVGSRTDCGLRRF